MASSKHTRLGRLLPVFVFGIVAACGGSSSSSPGEPTTSATSTAASATTTSSATPPSGGLSKELIDQVVSLDVGNPSLVDTANGVVKTGNAEAIKLAGDQLVKVGKRVGRPEWRTEKRSAIESTMRQRGAVPSPADLDLAALDAQTEAMRPILDAMAAVGGAAIVSFAITEAADATLPMERRRMAAVVAAKHVTANDPRASQVAVLQKELDQRSAAASVQSLDQAPSVLQDLAKDFRRCFQEEMKASGPTVDFRGTLELTLDPEGRVSSAHLRDAPPEKLRVCVEAAAKKGRFDPPKAGKATLRVPLNFTVN